MTNWGAAGQNLARIAPASYADGMSAPAYPSFPNPRSISNSLFNQTISLPDPNALSEYVWVWGQFIDHDIDHTLLQSGADRIDVTIPADDMVFTPGAIIPVDRSVYDPTTGTSTANPRQQISNISAWLDGGVVYGGRASEPGGGVARADWLRSFDSGRLKVTHDPVLGDLLPTQDLDGDGVRDLGAPGMASDTMIGPKAFVAGDVRANEHAALTAMHTLFVREHNRLADWVAATQSDLPGDPMARDEEIYQRARKLVGAEIQAITYNQFLPSMGLQLPAYLGYNAAIDPTVTNEFATAAYRMGHSQINGVSLRLNADGTSIAEGPLNLFEGFFDPSKLTDEGGLEPLLRGLAAQIQEDTDTKMSDGLRNLLFTGFPGGGPVANGTDLASLNIQRGRDHGLADYNTTRMAMGLGAVTQFSDITSDPDLQTQLEAIYGSVNSIDLWVGVLAEDHLPGACVGELTAAILDEQFVRLRDGDRFYFENDADLAMWLSPDGTPGTALNWLRGLTLSDVIEANTQIDGLRTNLFVVPEPATFAIAMLGAVGMWGFTRKREHCCSHLG